MFDVRKEVDFVDFYCFLLNLRDLLLGEVVGVLATKARWGKIHQGLKAELSEDHVHVRLPWFKVAVLL